MCVQQNLFVRIMNSFIMSIEILFVLCHLNPVILCRAIVVYLIYLTRIVLRA